MQNTATPDTTAAVELVTTAKAIGTWQAEQSPRISDESMLKRYPALGSVKTFKRLQNGDTSNLDIEGGDWLKDYRQILGQVQLDILGRGDDPIYSDLTPAREVAQKIKDLSESRGVDRILIEDCQVKLQDGFGYNLLATRIRFLPDDIECVVCAPTLKQLEAAYRAVCGPGRQMDRSRVKSVLVSSGLKNPEAP